jgi:tryptophan-rich sensory protein
MQIEATSPTRLNGSQIVAAMCFAAATALVAWLGSLQTADGRDWYDGLTKPAFTPPDATFGIVWTILYVLIAVAGWLAWRPPHWRPVPTMLWSLQLILNLGWTIAFFGLRSPTAGLVVIAGLALALIGAIAAAWRASELAGAMLLPYLGWVLFAAALNVGVLVLN